MVRHSSGLKTLSGTSPTTLWTTSIDRSSRITKITIYNPDTADHTVYIGKYDGTTFTQVFPGIKVLAGETVILNEEDIPAEKTYSTKNKQYSWAAKLEASVTANNVEITIEVEEQ